jgi:thiamine biosynthesis lipoprotein
MRRTAATGAMLAAFLAGCSIAEPAGLARHEFEEPHMGTRVRVVLYAASPDEARAAATAAFDVMRAVDAGMSDYRPDSELSRLSARSGAGPVDVSPELRGLLELARDVSRNSDGAFDVTVGPLVELWRDARRRKVLPTAEEIAVAKARTGYERMSFPGPGRVELETPGMKLDLGGIAKGYACDRALAAMAALGVRRAFVDAGGGMALGEPPPGKPGWSIAMLGDRSRILVLSACGVATSGDSEQFVEIDGTRYSHIVDPATGLGLRRREMATVLAKDGTTADALATACCVLGPERALALAAGLRVEAWIQCIEDGRRRRAETPGFAARTAPYPED